ncbi:MAG: sulfatase-like hydrolase/transferase, partial [Planctomycetes bacterium]|nr:sulfatase-like hydrolase/transferase [Planctomycetota bacterium]
MSIRITPALLVVASLLSFAAFAGSVRGQGDVHPAPPSEPRPNILWLVVEDMSPWLPCYGDATVATPNLDRLAAASVRFTNAFATSPVCAPARSSLITGEFATRIGTMQ